MNEPLQNKIVYLSRDFDQSREEIALLQKAGAEVIAFSTIKTVPSEEDTLLKEALKDYRNIDYIVFTSVNSVRSFFEKAGRIAEDFEIEEIKVACTGDKTAAECERFGCSVDIIPNEYSAKGLLEYFSKKDISGKYFLIPCSNIARNELREGLLEKGAIVKAVPIYNTIIPDKESISEKLELVKNSMPDIFVFTSPSSFTNFLELLEIDNPKRYFDGKYLCAIGSVTANSFVQEGCSANLIPKKFNIISVVEELIRKFA